MLFRQEHPDPQWERSTWRNLNGQWEFAFDFGNSAIEREMFKSDSLPLRITVPFCPESELSGIGYRDFMPAVCYRRTFALSEAELAGHVLLHFGAVDFESHIYINGEFAGKHIGGYASFALDITKFAHAGENVVFVIVKDDVRSGQQPAGKQSNRYGSWGCFYTRTTGIWQTVWLEFVPESYIKKAKYYPDPVNGTLTVLGQTCGAGEVHITACYEGRRVGSTAVQVCGGQFAIGLKLDEVHLWEPGQGRLYDLELTFGEDRVNSYFGLRNVCLEGKAFKVNGKTVFLRTVLDQGYYPDGLYTAKSDEELKQDITLSMAAGFNGARLHQKVFEKRFLYHCDQAGYMVWGEHGNWGMDYTDPVAAENFVCEWTEILDRDFNSPALIGWCPFNETWNYYETKTKHRLLEAVYKVTKQADSTRPCIAVSGNYHIADMEIYDVHDYCDRLNNSPDTFRDNYAHIAEGKVNDQITRNEGNIQPYKGQPIFVSEYGGFSWIEEGAGWGYGDAPKTKEELLQRYTDYTNVLLDNPDIMGFCYTQLYDIEQEKNGLYTYSRQPKLDMGKIRAVNERQAAIEK